MSLLRRYYFRGMFRWAPPPEVIELAGEAETLEFQISGFAYDAFAAASCLDVPWSAAARAWVDEIDQLGIAVAIEQCCHEGRLLPAEIRAVRLGRFYNETARAAERAITHLPDECGDSALLFVCWFVRIERARRTGCPTLDPARPPAVLDW